LKINHFCAENNENYIYSSEKLHKKLLPPELPFLTQMCTKSLVGWGKEGEGPPPRDSLAWSPQCLHPALLVIYMYTHHLIMQYDAVIGYCLY